MCVVNLITMSVLVMQQHFAYFFLRKSQQVLILKLHSYFRYAARFDCGSEFDMEVKMYAENKEELLDSHQFNCNLNAGRQWFQVCPNNLIMFIFHYHLYKKNGKATNEHQLFNTCEIQTKYHIVVKTILMNKQNVDRHFYF